MGLNTRFIKENLPSELHEVVNSRIYTFNRFVSSATSDLEVKYNLPDQPQSVEFKPAVNAVSTSKPDTSRVVPGIITAAAHQEKSEVDDLAELRAIIYREAA